MDLFVSLADKNARTWYKRGVCLVVAMIMMAIPVMTTVLVGCAPVQPIPPSYSVSVRDLTVQQVGTGHNVFILRNGVPVVSGSTTFHRTGGTAGIGISNAGVLTATGPGHVTFRVNHNSVTVIHSARIDVHPNQTGPGDGNGNGNGGYPGNGGDPVLQPQNPNAAFWIPVDYTNLPKKDGFGNYVLDGEGNMIFERNDWFGVNTMDFVDTQFGQELPEMQDMWPGSDGRTVSTRHTMQGTIYDTNPHVLYSLHTGVSFNAMGANFQPSLPNAHTTRSVFASRIGQVIEVVNNVGHFNNTRADGFGNYIIVEHEIRDWEATASMINFSLRNFGPVIRTSFGTTRFWTRYSNLAFNGVYVEPGDIVGGLEGQTFRGQETQFPYGTAIARMGVTGLTNATRLDSGFGGVSGLPVDERRTQLGFHIWTETVFPGLLQDTVYRVYIDPLDGERILFIANRDIERAQRDGRRDNLGWVHVDETQAPQLLFDQFIWAGDNFGFDVFLELIVGEGMMMFLDDAHDMLVSTYGMLENYWQIGRNMVYLFNERLPALWSYFETWLDDPTSGLRTYFEGLFEDLIGGLTRDFNWLIAYLQGLPTFYQARVQAILDYITDVPGMIGNIWGALQAQLFDMLMDALRGALRATFDAALDNFKIGFSAEIGLSINIQQFRPQLVIVEDENNADTRRFMEGFKRRSPERQGQVVQENFRDNFINPFNNGGFLNLQNLRPQPCRICPPCVSWMAVSEQDPSVEACYDPIRPDLGIRVIIDRLLTQSLDNIKRELAGNAELMIRGAFSGAINAAMDFGFMNQARWTGIYTMLANQQNDIHMNWRAVYGFLVSEADLFVEIDVNSEDGLTNFGRFLFAQTTIGGGMHTSVGWVALEEMYIDLMEFARERMNLIGAGGEIAILGARIRDGLNLTDISHYSEMVARLLYINMMSTEVLHQIFSANATINLNLDFTSGATFAVSFSRLQLANASVTQFFGNAAARTQSFNNFRAELLAPGGLLHDLDSRENSGLWLNQQIQMEGDLAARRMTGNSAGNIDSFWNNAIVSGLDVASVWGNSTIEVRITMLARLMYFNERALRTYVMQLGRDNVWGTVVMTLLNAERNFFRSIDGFMAGLTPFVAMFNGQFDGVMRVVMGDVFDEAMYIIDTFMNEVWARIKNESTLRSAFMENVNNMGAWFGDGRPCGVCAGCRNNTDCIDPIDFNTMWENTRHHWQNFFNGSIDWWDVTEMIGSLFWGYDSWTRGRLVQADGDLGARLGAIFRTMTRQIGRAVEREVLHLGNSLIGAMFDLGQGIIDIFVNDINNLSGLLTTEIGVAANIEAMLGLDAMMDDLLHGDEGIATIFQELLTEDQFHEFFQDSLVELLKAREGDAITRDTRIVVNGQFEFVRIDPNGRRIEEVINMMTDEQFDRFLKSLRVMMVARDVDFRTEDGVVQIDPGDPTTGVLVDPVTGRYIGVTEEELMARVFQFIFLMETAFPDFEMEDTDRILLDHSARRVVVVSYPAGKSLFQLTTQEYVLALTYLTEMIGDNLDVSSITVNGGSDDQETIWGDRIQTTINFLEEVFGFIPGQTPQGRDIDRDTWVRVNFQRQSVEIRRDGVFVNTFRNVANSKFVGRFLDLSFEMGMGFVSGFAIGAAVGSVVPGPGTVVGVCIGVVGGVIVGTVAGVRNIIRGEDGLFTGQVIPGNVANRIRNLRIERIAAATGFVQNDLREQDKEDIGGSISVEVADRHFGATALLYGRTDIAGEVISRFNASLNARLHGDNGLYSQIEQMIREDLSFAGIIDNWVEERTQDVQALVEYHVAQIGIALQQSLVDFTRNLQAIVERAVEQAIEEVKVEVMLWVVGKVSEVSQRLGEGLGAALGFLLPPVPASWAFNVERGIAINFLNLARAIWAGGSWLNIVYPVVRNSPWWDTFRNGVLVPPHMGGPNVPEVRQREFLNDAIASTVFGVNNVFTIGNNANRILLTANNFIHLFHEIAGTEGEYRTLDQIAMEHLHSIIGTVSNPIGFMQMLSSSNQNTLWDIIGFDESNTFRQTAEVIAKFMMTQELASKEASRAMNQWIHENLRP